METNFFLKRSIINCAEKAFVLSAAAAARLLAREDVHLIVLLSKPSVGICLSVGLRGYLPLHAIGLFLCLARLVQSLVRQVRLVVNIKDYK